MKATYLLLAGGLALLLGACSTKSGGGGGGPPPLGNEHVVGKWKAAVPDKLITGYEFTDDGSFKMSIAGMEQPVVGKWEWAGHRAIDLEYPTTPEVKQAYAKAVKDYKDGVKEKVRQGKIPDRVLVSLTVIHDDLPPKENMHVAVIEDANPELVLIDESGTSQNFVKAK